MSVMMSNLFDTSKYRKVGLAFVNGETEEFGPMRAEDAEEYPGRYERGHFVEERCSGPKGTQRFINPATVCEITIRPLTEREADSLRHYWTERTRSALRGETEPTNE